MMEAVDVCVGTRVTLDARENPRLHGAEATVTSVETWGVHVDCPTAATGKFRALWMEISPRAVPTGGLCDVCGGASLVRTGSCVTCQDCGANSGCG